MHRRRTGVKVTPAVRPLRSHDSCHCRRTVHPPRGPKRFSPPRARGPRATTPRPPSCWRAHAPHPPQICPKFRSDPWGAICAPGGSLDLRRFGPLGGDSAPSLTPRVRATARPRELDSACVPKRPEPDTPLGACTASGKKFTSPPRRRPGTSVAQVLKSPPLVRNQRNQQESTPSRTPPIAAIGL